ncbi:hypothetical protein HPB51_000032 [Rhipicephalus microplus]|uniref:Uncharacterized protein n=1 Tax=Rhipicephalus microplus TaxID=6941 RepID=A0A9J6DXX1_RHIMP|nr:hypothetical protein HPB51_000032 [Rhipicephalus microplus]
MSSTSKKATEHNESSNTEMKKPTAVVDASAASLFAAEKPEAASTQSDSEKAVAARVSNAEVQPQNHRSTSVVNPQPCPSVMLSPIVAASASDARTSQTMAQDVPAKLADTAVKQDASPRTALSKRTPAADLPSKADHLGDAPSTGSDSPAITGSTISPGKPGSMVSASSQVADMYKTLETLTAFGEKQRTRQDSTRASNTTYNIRLELSSITKCSLFYPEQPITKTQGTAPGQGKLGSTVPGPSQVADMYKTLETLTAFGEKERTRQDSTRASNTTFNIRMELSSITVSKAKMVCHVE